MRDPYVIIKLRNKNEESYNIDSKKPNRLRYLKHISHDPYVIINVINDDEECDNIHGKKPNRYRYYKKSEQLKSTYSTLWHDFQHINLNCIVPLFMVAIMRIHGNLLS